MNKKILQLLMLATIVSAVFISNSASALDTATAFKQYSNPHSICDYYRKSGYAIERESDNECLTSLGEGQAKTYTQYYYSGSNWCYKLTQAGQTYSSNCVPIPSQYDSEDAAIIVVGVVIFIVIIIAISSSGSKSKAAKKKGRSGRGSYGWEEMETSTTEANVEPMHLPENAHSQGGIGLHQGESMGGVANDLEKLGQLKDKGLISQREFNKAKKKLLK